MKNSLFISLLALGVLIGGCNKIGSKNEPGEDSFTIQGKLQHASGEPIYLSELGEQQFVSRDTAKVGTECSFQFTCKATDPGIQININWPIPTSYKNPGPPVFSC